MSKLDNVIIQSILKNTNDPVISKSFQPWKNPNISVMDLLSDLGGCIHKFFNQTVIKYNDGVYTFVTNDFMFEGGDLYTMIKPAAINAQNTYQPIRELLIDATRKAGVIKASSNFNGLKVQ